MRVSKWVLGSLAPAVVGLAILSLHAQHAAQMNVDRDGAIEAGSTVTFTVKLDKASNVDVNSVSVNVSPASPDPNVNGTGASAGSSNAEKTLYKIPVTIPVTARSGAWHVTSLSLNLASAPSKQLKFNDLSFEVKEKRDIILPDRGSIEITK
jgi:hypothetical protein